MQLTAYQFRDNSIDGPFLDENLPQLDISAEIIRSNALQFRKGFSGTTSYAVKANDNPGIVRLLYDSGITHFDVASLQEMETVKAVAPNARIHHHNPVRSTYELESALSRHDCKRFAVDHLEELEKILTHVRKPSDIEIAVRFRDSQPSQAVQAFKSKFGASELEAVQLLANAKAYGFKVGLTFHPGSQTLNPTPYTQHIETAGRISRTSGIALDFLNVGGGFPSDYEGLEFAPLANFFNAIDKAIDVNFPGAYRPSIECEPGRALVASAGTLTTMIKAIRYNRSELFLNDGIYGGLMEVSQFPQLQPKARLKNPPCRINETVEWTIFGPTCDPIDQLPFKISLPSSIKEGDQLQFHGVGAYSTATATRFNGYGCIEVAIRN